MRNFESTLRMLAQRGHEVHVVARPVSSVDPTNLAARLAAGCPGITYDRPPARPIDGWALLGEELRRGVDYLLYLGPEYRHAAKLRQRARGHAPPFVLDAVVKQCMALAAIAPFFLLKASIGDIVR